MIPWVIVFEAFAALTKKAATLLSYFLDSAQVNSCNLHVSLLLLVDLHRGYYSTQVFTLNIIGQDL